MCPLCLHYQTQKGWPRSTAGGRGETDNVSISLLKKWRIPFQGLKVALSITNLFKIVQQNMVSNWVISFVSAVSACLCNKVRCVCSKKTKKW